jgi:type IX secretion system PorP/SprF family membrane protein
MKNVYKKIGIAGLILCSINSLAQQDAMYTHYMFNTLTVNPAYAGSRQALTANLIHRSQWVSMEGAPTSQTFTIHDAFKSKKIGLGLSASNDKTGPVKSMSVNADFAYIVRLNRSSRLAFGLKAGINYMEVKLNSLLLDEKNDPSFQNNIKGTVLPNFGFGMYYSTPVFYAGISSPHLLENNFRDRETGFSKKGNQMERHYYLIAGGLVQLNDNVILKPSAFIKATKAAPVQADLSTSFILYNKVRIGAMLRTGDALGLLAGYYITDNFSVGYSYDWSFGLETMKYNRGSHEIMLSYELPKKPVKSSARFL